MDPPAPARHRSPARPRRCVAWAVPCWGRLPASLPCCPRPRGRRLCALSVQAAPACVVTGGIVAVLRQEGALSVPGWTLGEFSASSLLQLGSAVCLGAPEPPSHPARHVAADQVESFQRAGLSAASPSARGPRQGDAAQRGSAGPAPTRQQPPPAPEAGAACPRNCSWGHQWSALNAFSRPPHDLLATNSGLNRIVVVSLFVLYLKKKKGVEGMEEEF